MIFSFLLHFIKKLCRKQSLCKPKNRTFFEFFLFFWEFGKKNLPIFFALC